MPNNIPKKDQSQIEKFREAARELETVDSEEAFDRALRKVMKTQLKNDVGKKDQHG